MAHHPDQTVSPHVDAMGLAGFDRNTAFIRSSESPFDHVKHSSIAHVDPPELNALFRVIIEARGGACRSRASFQREVGFVGIG